MPLHYQPLESMRAVVVVQGPAIGKAPCGWQLLLLGLALLAAAVVAWPMSRARG